MRPIKRVAQPAAWCAISLLAAQPVLAGECDGKARQVDSGNWNANTKVFNKTSRALFIEFSAQKRGEWTLLKTIESLAPGDQIGVTRKNAAGDQIMLFVLPDQGKGNRLFSCTYLTESVDSSRYGQERTKWTSRDCKSKSTSSLQIKCEKSWNRNKSRWNTQFTLKDL